MQSNLAWERQTGMLEYDPGGGVIGEETLRVVLSDGSDEYVGT